MGLIELCLLSLLSPQEPAGAQSPVREVPQPTPTAAESAAKADIGQDPRARLQALEADGKPDAAELLALTTTDDDDAAARAAWLLANSDDPECTARLPEVLTRSPHAAARRQALQKLRIVGDVDSMPHALQALRDEDRDVRTLAVLLLGKLRRPAAREPLLNLVHDHAGDGGEASDVVAAILALADFGTPDHLLRMSTAVDDGTVAGTGQALAYAFQTLSPKLPADEELTTLVAVLGHREAVLRRYAIERLAELGDDRAIPALEARLATEGKELRQLLEVAIAQLRGDDEPATGELARAAGNAKILWARLQGWWRNLAPAMQATAAAAPVLLIAVVWLLVRLARRRRHDADARVTAALVQPSDDYLEEQEYEEDEDYEDYEDCEEEEYDDYEAGDDQQEFAEDDGADYDTSGWEDDDAELADGAVIEDERFN